MAYRRRYTHSLTSKHTALKVYENIKLSQGFDIPIKQRNLEHSGNFKLYAWNICVKLIYRDNKIDDY